MKKLKGYQKKYLKGLAHDKKPLVFVGHRGVTPAVTKAVDEALETHELIKVKFVDLKKKDQKKEIVGAIAIGTAAELVGMIGHIAIFFRQQGDPEKRNVRVPER